VVLVAVAFAAAAAFTMLAVQQLTGSMILALLAAIAEVAIVPRTYEYPKLLMVDFGFIREPLGTCLPDAIVPLVVRALRTRPLHAAARCQDSRRPDHAHPGRSEFAIARP
jgi:hypothetical protein